MAERIVVIGSNSFSGSHFARHALAQGLEVVGISRSAELAHVFLPYRWPGFDAARFRFAQLDLNHDTDKIAQLIGDLRPEYVVNFSAQGMVAESWLTPEHWYQTNIVGNVKLHDRLRRFDFLQRYVHISTPEVYGSCSGLVKEDAPFHPSTPYAASRAGCELHLRTFLRNYRFPVVFTRAANVYGPGQQLYRIIPRTILCVLLGKKLALHGGGHSVRSFIHIGDVADGTLRVARQGANGEAYHFSTTLMISIRELVEKICAMMGANFSDVAEVTDDRPGKDSAYLLDSAKARETLGWADRIDLETGLRETIEWVRGNLETLKTQPQDYVHKP
jgi:dTDP-glucose 4,6-dehydratase